MGILIEILTTMWQVIWGLISGIGKAILKNLPALLEMKKVFGYFTPVGMIAIYLGVPTVVISIAFKLIKKFVRSRQ